jgi:hypothetical protein
MTKVQIISFALSLLGKKPILNLDNQSDITSAAEQAFDFKLPVILSTGPWRFGTTIAPLTKLNKTPIVSNWKYIYQLPSDFLKLTREYPHNYAYEFYENGEMYSNLDGPLFLEYVRQPDPSRLPAYFANYLAYVIAEVLALSSAHKVDFSSKLKEDMGVAMGQGLAADAQNRPQSSLASQPIITNRSTSGGALEGPITNID